MRFSLPIAFRLRLRDDFRTRRARSAVFAVDVSAEWPEFRVAAGVDPGTLAIAWSLQCVMP